jgi:hypothetical protein
MKQLMMISLLSMVMTACATGSGPIDLSKLPPIVIAAPAPAEAPKAAPTPAAKPKATLAFHVLNLAGDELDGAIATVKKDGAQVDVEQAVKNGYIPFVLETGAFYDVTFELADYKTITRKFQHGGDHQWDIVLSRDGEPIVPNPLPSPPAVAVPPATPPVVTPTPIVIDPAEAAATWSDEQWRDAFFSILKKHKAPRTVNLQTLNDTRADIEALGAEWQHTSDGTLRPRLFLPVPFGADPYSRAVDVGLYDKPWEWIKR